MPDQSPLDDQTFDVRLDVIELADPSDSSGLSRLLESVDPVHVVAIVGKTEGSGMGKDTGREATSTMIHQVLGRNATHQVDHVATVLSGGSPGVITPHLAVLSRIPSAGRDTASADPRTQARLMVGTAASERIEPAEIGRTGQVDKVAHAVTQAISDARIASPADVHAVFVKAPTLLPEHVVEADAAGSRLVTDDLGIGPNGAICWSNDASALGVAVALGEVDRSRVTDHSIRRNFSMFSDVAITSSAGEKSFAEVVVLGNSASSISSLRIGHSPMMDVLDIDAVDRSLLASCMDATSIQEARGRCHYAMGKMILPGDRTVRGSRVTWHDDPWAFHVAKAMGGYALAAVTGRTCSFVSGGEANSHQGPPGGNPLAVVTRCV